MEVGGFQTCQNWLGAVFPWRVGIALDRRGRLAHRRFGSASLGNVDRAPRGGWSWVGVRRLFCSTPPHEFPTNMFGGHPRRWSLCKRTGLRGSRWWRWVWPIAFGLCNPLRPPRLQIIHLHGRQRPEIKPQPQPIILTLSHPPLVSWRRRRRERIAN